MLSLGLKMRVVGFTAMIATVLTTGLKAWHKFTATAWSGSNRLPDSSGNSNTAALYTGRGLSFDGVNDVVTIGATGVTVKTVVFYAYPDTTTQSFMQLQSTGAVRIQIVSGTLSATGFTSPTLYVNGAASSTVAASAWQQIAVSSATGVSASNVLLGQSNTTFYGGDLSNVKFFSVELTAGQIAELYANPEQGLPTGVSAAELVGWWTLTESTSFCTDSSVTAKTGIISGASSLSAINGNVLQTGLLGRRKVMYFDGSNDSVSIGAAGAYTSNFTLLVWAYIPEIGVGRLMSRRASGTNWDFFLDSSGYMSLYNGTTTFQHSTTIATGRCVLLAFVENGAACKFYINTTASADRNITLPSQSLTTYIGSFNNSSGFLKGVIYTCAIWASRLSASEIADIYNGGTDFNLSANSGNYISSSNLTGWWKNTGNTNADWLDLSGSGYNGTVIGSPTTIDLITGISSTKDLSGGNLNKLNTGQLILNGDGYASIADAATLDITTNVTLEAWVKPFAVSAAQTIIGKTGSYALGITSGAKPVFTKWTSAASSATPTTSTTLSVNTWYDLAAP